MIEEAPIVKDIRRVRRAISEQFGNDPDKYIDYLLSQKTDTVPKRNAQICTSDWKTVQNMP
ncbi:hypothetical protein QUF72_08980 [Desulfobacterales bacterium HSG2]|nr:hypothetical protein [Desulfobacterales bacterium HSG2]